MSAKLAGVGCAVRRYEIVNGKLPENLDELVGEGLLESVPVDPFSGEPVKYSQDDDGFTLYSLGADEKDDGGQ